MSYRLLILNPGSTSTKAAVYDGDRQVAMKSIVHTNQDLAPYPTLYDQLDYRVALVRGWLGQEGIGLSTLSAVVGRGGIIPNIVAGGYVVDDNLVDCLRNYPVFDHASNLGGLMARAFAQPLGIPAYIYDAVTSDELLPEARVTGFKEVTRTSFCHVLNARATAHKYAEALGRKYEDMNLVVAHLGGGISISAHSRGRIIDSVSDDAGPFSPDRSGSLNMLYVSGARAACPPCWAPTTARRSSGASRTGTSGPLWSTKPRPFRSPRGWASCWAASPSSSTPSSSPEGWLTPRSSPAWSSTTSTTW